MSTTTLTVNQKLRAAGEKSRLVRQKRSRLRAEIHMLPADQGQALLADAIETLPDWLATQDAALALSWPRGMTAELVDRRLRQANVLERRPFNRLTNRQRLVLADLLRQEA